MYRIIFHALFILSGSVHAEVFKCKSASAIIKYQAEPCSGAAQNLGKVNIKPIDPKAEAEVKQRFAAWQAEQDRLEAIKIQQNKGRQLEYERQLAIDAILRNALAQQQKAVQPPVIINNFIAPYKQPGFQPPFKGPGRNFVPPSDQRFAPFRDDDPRFAPFH